MGDEPLRVFRASELMATRFENDGRDALLVFKSMEGHTLGIMIPSSHLAAISSVASDLAKAARARENAGAIAVPIRLIQKWQIGAHPMSEHVVFALDQGTDNAFQFAVGPRDAQEMEKAIHRAAKHILRRRSGTSH